MPKKDTNDGRRGFSPDRFTGDRAYDDRGRVIPVNSLQQYFHESIEAVVSRQSVEIDPHATHYVVNLLTLYSRSEALYEDAGGHYGLKPLAIMMRDAVDAPTLEERQFALRRLGDVALFIAGCFADSLAEKLVDLDYYIYMGGSAYGSLSDEMRGSVRGRAFSAVFAELARKFQVMVDVLNEVSESARASQDRDILRLYEVWLKTGSRRAEALLRREGIEPLSDSRPGTRH